MPKNVSIADSIDEFIKQPFQLFFWLWVSIYYLDLAEHWQNSMECGVVFLLVLGQMAVRSNKYLPLLTLFILQIFMIQKLPILANHNLIMFFGNFLIAAHIVFPHRVNSQILSRSLILCLAVVYFWAGFHKINLDFIYGGRGCANFMLKDLLWNFMSKDSINFIANSLWPGLLTIIAELFISVCFFFHPFFLIGSLSLLLFHSIIILSGIVDFAYVPLVILIYTSLVFLKGTKSSSYKKFAQGVLLIVLVTLFLSSLGAFIPELVKQRHIHFVQMGSWWVLAVGLGWYSVKNRKLMQSRLPLQNLKGLVLQMTFPLLLFILGSTSYLGLNTTRNFSMFSNLRTEGNEWNHFIVPKSLRIFSYQDEVYWVQEIDQELMFSFRESPMLQMGLVSFEVQRLYRLWRQRSRWPKNFILKRASDGKVADARDFIPETSEISPLAFKLMYFRPIRYGLGAECMW